MDVITPVPSAPTSKVHMWILLLLGWTAVFSLIAVGLLLTRSTDTGLSTTELSAACQNGTINGITTNLTRISDACQSTEVKVSDIPVHIASSAIPSEITPEKQSEYVASQFPSSQFSDVIITTQTLPNGILYTVTNTRIGSVGVGNEMSMYFFGTTTLVVVNYSNTDLSSIHNVFDWLQVK